MEDGRDKNVRIVSRDGASPERDAMARKKEKKKKKKRERKEREGVVNERARKKMTIKTMKICRYSLVKLKFFDHRQI